VARRHVDDVHHAPEVVLVLDDHAHAKLRGGDQHRENSSWRASRRTRPSTIAPREAPPPRLAASLDLLGCDGGPEHGGAVMMDEEPAAVPALEEVRRLHLCRDPAVVVTTLDVLGHDHPGEVTLHFDRGVAEREPNLERALEDALPALHHGSPADE